MTSPVSNMNGQNNKMLAQEASFQAACNKFEVKNFEQTHSADSQDNSWKMFFALLDNANKVSDSATRSVAQG